MDNINIVEVKKEVEFINNEKIEKSSYIIENGNKKGTLTYLGKELNSKKEILLYLINSYENYYKKTVGYSEFSVNPIFNDRAYNLEAYKKLNYHGLLTSNLLSDEEINELKGVL